MADGEVYFLPGVVGGFGFVDLGLEGLRFRLICLVLIQLLLLDADLLEGLSLFGFAGGWVYWGALVEGLGGLAGGCGLLAG